MDFKNNFRENLFKINPSNFNRHALDLFRYQAIHNEVYRQYIGFRKIDPAGVKEISEIPFLPIGLFKTQPVITGQQQPPHVFHSSATTGMSVSKHYVSDLAFYDKVSEYIFNQFYGPLSDYIFIALLPSYQENKNSSLIHMINSFIKKSGSDYSRFISEDFEELHKFLPVLRNEKKQIMLFAVTFALLDLAEMGPVDLSDLVIVETGGMKGRREEITRSGLHSELKKAFNLKHIHSEYGMAELLSQAYSAHDGTFHSCPWMKILLREINDPFSLIKDDFKSGGINIIDLANIDSCAFIETQDIGRKMDEKSFEILGRFDNSDVRGCNLMYLS
jgi:hypothetical protein